MTRYNPSYQVLAGGVDVTADAFDVGFRDAVTNQAGTFKIQLVDRFQRYTNQTAANLYGYKPVVVSLDGTQLLKGRIDDIASIINKKGAAIFEINGRSDFATLIDIQSSKHVVQETAYQIVNEIIAQQNALAQSDDPVLSIVNNDADNSIKFNFLWKRKSLQEMLLDISNKLGSPSSQGGVNQFYDFYVNPFDGFYFVPAGSLNSNVDLGYPGGKEVKQRKQAIDANTVKNDVWTWAMNTAAGVGLGRIPLTMQPGYAGYPLDSWTEG